jgi:NitT/TauT family transport system substrate-binding protein
MRANRDTTVKLISDLYEVPPEIAALEYENTILKLETDGDMSGPKIKDAVQLSMDLAKLGGLKDIAPTEELYSAAFKPAPTKP